MAKMCNVNEYVLKLIVGHAIQDITESVYTHRKQEEFFEEINKIKLEVGRINRATNLEVGKKNNIY